MVRLLDSRDLSSASAGTKYFVGNPEILTVDADGLATTNAPGTTAITVINGPAEFVLPVTVDSPQIGPVIVGPDGAVVQGDGGLFVQIPPGALDNDVDVSIAPLAEADFTLNAPDGFELVGGFELQLSGSQLNEPAQVAVPVDPSIPAGSEVYFFQEGILNDENGDELNLWWQIENGIVGTDGFARTTPPHDSINQQGRIGVFTAGEDIGVVKGVLDYTIGGIAGVQGALAAVAGLGGGAALGAIVQLGSGFHLRVPGGTVPITVLDIPEDRIATKTVFEVEVEPGKISEFRTTYYPKPRPSQAPSDPPEIHSARLSRYSMTTED